MSFRERRTFPLVPRRRLTGLPFGDLPSRRRGHGSEVIGSRLYEPGDPVSTIDWFASAQLSEARGSDEFVVRDRAADEAPRVTIVLDRRPAMGLYPEPLPGSRSGRRSARLRSRSQRARRPREPTSLRSISPAARRGGCRRGAATGPGSSPSAPARRRSTRPRTRCALVPLARAAPHRHAGRNVPVRSLGLSRAAADRVWLDTSGHGWDLVPVVIQDPVWERSWPETGGVAVPVADPRSGREWSSSA